MKKDKSVTVLAGLKIKPEFCEEFLERAKEVVTLTRKEAGCVRYDLVRDVFDSTAFYFIEEYVDDDAFQTHRVMPYMPPFRDFRAKVVAEYFGVSTFERISQR